MSVEIKGDVISSNSVVSNEYIKTDLAAPIMIAFDITNKCNFKCLHCFNHSGENCYSDELGDADKMKVVEQIIELKPYIVCLCGGETTCCGVLFDIIKKLKQHIHTVNMVSNGYLITDSFAKKLKEAQITSVQISLDGINPEQHDTFRGHYGAFDHAINAINILNNNQIPVMTSLVPNKLNYRDTYNYFALCHKLKVRSARCMPYLPMGRGKTLGEKLILNKKEFRTFIQQMLKAQEDFPELHIDWGDPVDHTYRLPRNAKLGMDSYYMDVKSNGDIGVSAYFPIFVGNCLKHSLKEYWLAGYNKIWNNTEIVKMMEEIQGIDDFRKLSDMKTYRIDLVENNYELQNK